jgi:hypothetical protein
MVIIDAVTRHGVFFQSSIFQLSIFQRFLYFNGFYISTAGYFNVHIFPFLMRGGNSPRDSSLFGFGFGSSKKFWILLDSDPQHWWEGEACFATLSCGDSDSDPAKSFGFFQIRIPIPIRIRNTDEKGSSLHDATLFGFGFGSRKKFCILSDSDQQTDDGGSSLRNTTHSNTRRGRLLCSACAPLSFLLSHLSIS